MTETTVEKATRKGRSQSEETRQKQRLRALDQGQARAAKVHAKVREAMKVIESEMEANGGIYSQNGGKVSEAEVYRRADVSTTTIYKNPDTYGALSKELKEWKVSLHEQKKPTGREGVRQTLAERAANWKKRHDDLMQVHQLTELELQSAEAKLEAALKQIEEFKRENKRLNDLLKSVSTSKVTPLLKKKI